MIEVLIRRRNLETDMCTGRLHAHVKMTFTSSGKSPGLKPSIAPIRRSQPWELSHLRPLFSKTVRTQMCHKCPETVLKDQQGLS